MTKLRIKNVLSCILVVTLVLGNCLTALAANSHYSSKEEVFTIYDDGETVVKGYEGYTPNDWRTQAMAVWFHNEMFGYTTWEVVNWS